MKNFIVSPLGVITLIVLLVVAGGASWVVKNKSTLIPPNEVACTLEAMQCPDGSYVGRSGPNCEFVCPTSGSTSTTTNATSTAGGGGIMPFNSGVQGTITMGPTCPVERNPPDPNCADKPVETNVSVYRQSDPTHGIAFITSDKQGNFKISLAPGNYIVMAGPNGVPYPRCQNATATVGPTGYTKVDISCDSGIR